MKAAADFVEDKDGAVLPRQIFYTLKESRCRIKEIDRLHNDCGKLTRMRVQNFVKACEIVIDKRMGQLAHGCWNARVPRGGPDVPVLPSVISATGDALALRECSRSANRTRSSVRPVLAEAHHLRTWNQPGQAFG